MHDNKVKIFNTPIDAADGLALRLKDAVNAKQDMFNLAVSGGNTPAILFDILASDEFAGSVKWENVHLWWCDERCVPPHDKNSNYGMTKNHLIDKIKIPAENIHRIKGEAEPNKEAVRYAVEIEKILCNGENCMPVFDWVLLGIGADGHTASIFPGKNLSFVYSNIAGVAQHPESGQKRISLTKEVLNNARKITFFVTGKEKAKVLSEIIFGHAVSKMYPAAKIKPVEGTIDWVIDKEAAFYL